MKHLTLLAFLLLGMTGAIPAQYFVPDHKGLRAVTRVSWHGESGEQNLAIEHGQPKWNASHEGLLQGRTAMHARLGNGAWTTLQTGVALSVGTTRIPRGRWYLGLQRDERENFALTFLAADDLDATGTGAFATGSLTPAFAVPMRLSRSEQSAELLDITLASVKVGNENVALTIAWGQHRLSTALVADFDRRRPAGAPEFALPAKDRLVTTASGLQYEVLRAGAGAFPAASDRVTLHYCGWLLDGTQFTSTHLGGGGPPTLTMDQVGRGLPEALQLMQPGAVFRFVVPPALGYGSTGVGAVIPPNATLVFTVSLVAIAK